MHSNPIVGAILAELDLNTDQTATIRRALDGLVRERARWSDSATLTAPIMRIVHALCSSFEGVN